MTVQKKKRWPFILAALVLLLVGAGAFALWRLDSWLLERARAEAATLSQKLGRPVEVGSLSTRLWPYLGVQARGLSIGPAQGEPRPLLQLERVDVAVEARTVLSSRGKDIPVTHAEVLGLTVNVLRLEDGTTNLSRLVEKLTAEPSTPAEPQQPPAPPRDLSAVRVDRVALSDGALRFLDTTRPDATELSISDLDMVVENLRAGRPLELKLDAAVLSAQQNLHARLLTAPLPPTLVPVPERVELQLLPIELGPLTPFLPPSVGLQAGQVQADYKAELGSAVSGGTGPTRLAGTLRAAGLRFAEAEGGKALDVVLESDVSVALESGDLSLGKLELALGPARLSGHGRVLGLLTDTPKVEDFELVGKGLDPAALAEYYPPLRKQLGGMIAGPVGLVVRGSGTQDSQALKAEVDLTPVRLRVPEQLAKEAGAPLRVEARIAGAAASGGALRFDAQADLTGADLRPGELLDKAPGQKLAVLASGTYRPARGSKPLEVDVSNLKVDVREYTLAGTAGVSLAGEGKSSTTSYRLALKSPRLDGDALMLSDEEIEALTGRVPPPSTDPTRFNGLRGDMRFEVGALRYSDMDLSNLVAVVKQEDDRITVERFTSGLYGGTVDASGTWVKMGPPSPERPFEARMQVRGMDVARVLADFSDRQVLAGRFNGDVDLKGVGFSIERLKETLIGAIDGSMEQGRLLGFDMVAAVAGPLAKALPFAAKALQAEKLTDLGEMLPFGVKIENGVALLKKPITWTQPNAAVRLEGGIRLDGTLALAGAVNLMPDLIKRLTGGRAVPTEPIPVALKLTGKPWAPQVEGLDLRPAVEAIVKLAASGAARNLLGDKGGQVVDQVLSGDALKRAQEEAEAKRRELEERARQEAEAAKRELEEKARQEAEAAKKRLEEEAKKRLRGIFGK